MTNLIIFGSKHSQFGINSIKGFLIDGKPFRTYNAEIEDYYAALERSAEADDFGALPIRVFTATYISPKNAKAKENQVRLEGEKKHLEFEDLSTDRTHTKILENHITIFSKQENAASISKEVIQLLIALKY